MFKEIVILVKGKPVNRPPIQVVPVPGKRTKALRAKSSPFMTSTLASLVSRYPKTSIFERKNDVQRIKTLNLFGYINRNYTVLLFNQKNQTQRRIDFDFVFEDLFW